jgi:hypothetical protein
MEIKVMQYYKIHKAASLVPLASKEEQDALREDINLNGQKKPIELYRGKIIDGRCRQNACIELEIGVNAIEVPNNWSLDEVESHVKSVNTRRNLTRTQKAVTAFKEFIDGKVSSMTIAAARWGVTKSELSNLKSINESKPKYIDILFNGGKIEFLDENGKIKKNATIYAIKTSIDREIKSVEEEGQSVEHQKCPKIAKGFKMAREGAEDMKNYIGLTEGEIVFIHSVVLGELKGKL